MTVLENVMVGAFLRHPHRNDARDHARRIVALTGLQPEQRARLAQRHAGDASASKSPACSPPIRACCCSTNRSPA